MIDMVNDKELLAIMPKSSLLWVPHLNAAMDRWVINSPMRAAMFLAHVAVESAELTRLEESLIYSSQRLMVVWPHKFPTLEIANKYAGKIHDLADFVYAGVNGNGDEISGDGYRYRGRGPIQITGADNYREFGKASGDSTLLLCPDRLLTKAGGASSAGWFFSSRHCNELADQAKVEEVTRKINGGLNGLAERQKYYEKARSVLT